MSGYVGRIARTLAAAMVGIGVMTAPASAWNDAGHMVVARIAWLRLTAPQRHAVFERLKAHPHFATSLIAGRPKNATDEEWAFLRAATWSDYVRPARPKQAPNPAEEPRVRFHRRSWHHVRFPYRAGQPESALPRERLPADTDVVEQIGFSLDVLRGTITHDPGAVAGLSAEANAAVRLCWLFHLVGDLHQPLHATTLVDEKLFPADDHSDEGGKLLAIRRSESDEPGRLHATWDGMLSSDASFDAVRRLADELTHDSALAPPTFPELASHREPRDWAAESYALAKTEIYRDGRFPLVRFADLENGTISAAGVPALSAAAATQARLLARRRVTLAGYRLAVLLAERAGQGPGK